MKYDCSEDVKKHINKVAFFMDKIIEELFWREDSHDASKLMSPEKKYFDLYTPLLWKLSYGSKEYEKIRKKMKPALIHHYKHNFHHPEHFKNGINGMDLVDLVEMLCDWMASTKKEKNGNINKSFKIAEKRFKISKQLMQILKNTVKRRFNA
jgi:hypothetical protein